MQKSYFFTIFIISLLLTSCTDTSIPTKNTLTPESSWSKSTQIQTTQSVKEIPIPPLVSTSTGGVDSSTGSAPVNSGSIAISSESIMVPTLSPEVLDTSYFARWQFQKFEAGYGQGYNKENPEWLYFYSWSARIQGEFMIFADMPCFRVNKKTPLDLPAPTSVDGEQKYFTKEELNRESAWFCFEKKSTGKAADAVGKDMTKKALDITSQPDNSRMFCTVGTATIEISDYIRFIAGTEMAIDGAKLDKIIKKQMYSEPKCE